MQNAALLAGMHCKLWLNQLQHKSLGQQADFETLSEGRISPTQADRWRIITQSLPDFGFILGQYWDVATLRERTDFNQSFTRFLKQNYKLSGDDSSKHCQLDIGITQKETEDDGSFVNFPQPRLFEAKAKTHLPSQTGDIAITYFLSQDLIGWQIDEIRITKSALKSRFREQFIQILRKGGYSQLNLWLVEQLDKAAPDHPH